MLLIEIITKVLNILRIVIYSNFNLDLKKLLLQIKLLNVNCSRIFIKDLINILENQCTCEFCNCDNVTFFSLVS